MDGLAVAAICREWNARFIGARLDKIHQPSDRDLVLTVRGKFGTERVLLSADRAQPRAHLLRRMRPSNPEEPPMFCMLVRKRVEGARIVAVRQDGFDRVIHLVMESFDELGDLKRYVFVLEIMGKHSNLMLCTAGSGDVPEKIIDSVVHVTPDMSRVRTVLPGLSYAAAPAQDKVTVDQLTVDQVQELQICTRDEKSQVRALCGLVAGTGPLTAREALHRAQMADANATAQAAQGIEQQIYLQIRTLWQAAQEGTEGAFVGLDDLGRPAVAAPYRITYTVSRSAEDFNDALEETSVETTTRVKQASAAKDLIQSVYNHQDRLRGKLTKLTQERAESVDHEQYRIQGELLTAYAYQVAKGVSSVTLPNFYDDEAPLTIALDPALTAVQNAQKMFKMSSKKKRAIPLLDAQILQVEEDLRYLDEVSVHLAAADMSSVDGIRAELEQQGFIQKRRTKAKSGARKGNPSGQPDVYISQDGFRIRVGRNNLQNDKLTLRQSQADDIWLHVKDLPGSHVVIATERADVPETTLFDAALLAAYFSKGRDSTNVAVDYTLIKHVWKPNGARPGHVLYEGQKTLYVTPDRTFLMPLLSRSRDAGNA